MTGLIELKEDASKTVVTSQNFDYTENDDPAYYNQLFSTPSNVQSGVKYVITVYYDPPATKIWRGTNGLANSSADCGGVTVNFQFYDADDEDDNFSRPTAGQIPRIMFEC